ncbi:hypothetical protein M3603_06560 [Rummeliibacillus stabekisii]|uniref:Uncharacterized protein n=1 Tax=Rummeliibacillus stabekisii TaxID=241244 RepID=A0A143HBQ4_9BACL|nr:MULTISPECIES: hypothetical protein [Rummeliibacillus]AMW98926.1 hypothetical protein ATY39_05325 [Rummeliibacillus stabekisii]MCM3316337.1 hypothetical protein [Rummeliibacillus stabekisii]
MVSSWLRIASIYFAISVGYGIYMYATDTYDWVIYAHLLILGWLSNAVIGYAYQYTNSGELENWQFYLFNIGLLLLFIGLIFSSVVLVWIGLVLIALSILLFLVRLFL